MELKEIKKELEAAEHTYDIFSRNRPYTNGNFPAMAGRMVYDPKSKELKTYPISVAEFRREWDAEVK